MKCFIRKYDDSDLPSLVEIYRKSINHVGHEYYSKEQIDVWSNYSKEMEIFRKWITDSTTFVAFHQQVPVGFGGLDEKGRISSLFVDPEAMRQGVGSSLLKRIMSEIENRGLNHITTDASEFSKPLFEKFGFRLKDIEHIMFKGVSFHRYAMELFLRKYPA